MRLQTKQSIMMKTKLCKSLGRRFDFRSRQIFALVIKESVDGRCIDLAEVFTHPLLENTILQLRLSLPPFN